jgi:glycosyltransferase involved in cell wall biosynthesis
VRVTHVSTHDLSGGAARAAYRLHTGLCGAGVASQMLVLYKESTDPSVLRFEPPRSPAIRLRRGMKRRFLKFVEQRIISSQSGSTMFSDDRSQHDTGVIERVSSTDILNLHWVSGFIDYSHFFRHLSRDIPIVWTLHDMNPFTGGCHYDEGCGKHRQRCGACPQLRSSDPNDFSARIWSRKREALSAMRSGNVHFVAPSRWLLNEARESALFGSFPSTLVPYGIDTERFKPRGTQTARERLKIPQDSTVVLFVADSAGERRKGFSFLVDALQRLQDEQNLYFLAVGQGISSYELGPRTVTLNRVEGEEELSVVYSAADVFVLPSLQDNFPNTALEALACGVPVVAFDVGGIPEIVRNDYTGVLVEAGNSEALAMALAELLKDTDRRRAMAANCRRVAVEEYTLEVQARRYVELYTSLLQRSPIGSIER